MTKEFLAAKISVKSVKNWRIIHVLEKPFEGCPSRKKWRRLIMDCSNLWGFKGRWSPVLILNMSIEFILPIPPRGTRKLTSFQLSFLVDSKFLRWWAFGLNFQCCLSFYHCARGYESNTIRISFFVIVIMLWVNILTRVIFT